MTKRQTMVNIALHRKLKIEQHEPQEKTRVNSGAPEGMSTKINHTQKLLLPGLSCISIVINQSNDSTSVLKIY